MAETGADFGDAVGRDVRICVITGVAYGEMRAYSVKGVFPCFLKQFPLLCESSELQVLCGYS